MAVLGLHFCATALSSCGKWGPLFIAVRGPPTIAASPVAEHKLQARRLSSCDTRTQPLSGTRDPPGPGLEPVSPALAGRLPTAVPPGKPPEVILICIYFIMSICLLNTFFSETLLFIYLSVFPLIFFPTDLWEPLY